MDIIRLRYGSCITLSRLRENSTTADPIFAPGIFDGEKLTDGHAIVRFSSTYVRAARCQAVVCAVWGKINGERTVLFEGRLRAQESHPSLEPRLRARLQFPDKMLHFLSRTLTLPTARQPLEAVRGAYYYTRRCSRFTREKCNAIKATSYLAGHENSPATMLEQCAQISFALSFITQFVLSGDKIAVKSIKSRDVSPTDSRDHRPGHRAIYQFTVETARKEEFGKKGDGSVLSRGSHLSAVREQVIASRPRKTPSALMVLSRMSCLAYQGPAQGKVRFHLPSPSTVKNLARSTIIRPS